MDELDDSGFDHNNSANVGNDREELELPNNHYKHRRTPSSYEQYKGDDHTKSLSIEGDVKDAQNSYQAKAIKGLYDEDPNFPKPDGESTSNSKSNGVKDPAIADLPVQKLHHHASDDRFVEEKSGDLEQELREEKKMPHSDDINYDKYNFREKDKEEEPDNSKTSEEFGSPLEYWLSVIGYAVGFGNVWRFPYLLYENGGGAFFIPYFFSLLFVCMPLFMLETAYGQLTRKKVHKFFSSISPKLKGFTYAQLFMGVISNIYYVVLLTWSIAFFINSFRTPLPWEMPEEDQEEGRIWNEEYFKYDLLESSDGIEDHGYIVVPMALCLIAAWILVYICIFKGIQSSGKIVYITAPLPYILLIVLLIRGMTLEGAFKGWKYLFVPDFSKIFKLKAWRDAVNQVIYSSSLGGGTLIMYSSFRKKNEKVLKSSIIIPLVNSATSILAALVLFSFVGYMAHTNHIEVEDVPISGLELAFVAYPALLTQLPGANFWAVMFFIMLVTVGIDSMFAGADTMCTMLYGFWHKYNYVPSQACVTIWYCIFCCFCSLLFTCQAGIYIFELFDHYAIGINLIVFLFMQTISIGWFFGYQKLADMAEEQTGEKFPKCYSVFIRYIGPIILVCLIIVSFAEEVSSDFGFPSWAVFVGWCFSCAPTLLIVLFAIFKKSKKSKPEEKYKEKEKPEIKDQKSDSNQE